MKVVLKDKLNSKQLGLIRKKSKEKKIYKRKGTTKFSFGEIDNK